MNIRTTVPFREVKLACRTSTAPTSAPPGDGAHSVVSPVRASNR